MKIENPKVGSADCQSAVSQVANLPGSADSRSGRDLLPRQRPAGPSDSQCGASQLLPAVPQASSLLPSSPLRGEDRGEVSASLFLPYQQRWIDDTSRLK